jgi:hypothetical protein
VRAAVALVLALAACGTDAVPLSGETAAAAKEYPDIYSLYSHDQGIYRGCGPSSGVCHNGNEFPNLDSLGSIVDNIGRDCNKKRSDATTVHDLCEVEGDRVVIGRASSEIAYIETMDTTTRTWRVVMREPIPLTDDVNIMRGDRLLYDITDRDITVTADGDSLVFRVPPPVQPSDPDDDVDPDFAEYLLRAGVPGDPLVVAVGDPNRNGTFGAELGGKLIKPGDPARSYLLSRLLDPEAGPLMPRANCCHWSKPAVRALYCWIEGLSSDASNAFAPIDYKRCSAGPSVELLYPEPGTSCELMGLCPVEAVAADDEPTFHNLYARVLVPACSGSGCHGAGPVANVDFSSEQRAFDSLTTRVVPGNPDASLLYIRLDPTLCEAPECQTMPLGRASLSDEKLSLVRAWIERGAER